jgi:hypothetical protein
MVQLATRISERSFFPASLNTPLFELWEKGARKLIFRKPPLHCAALVHSVSGAAGMPNRSRIGARTAVEAATIVLDVRYVT